MVPSTLKARNLHIIQNSKNFSSLSSEIHFNFLHPSLINYLDVDVDVDSLF